jgi:hypothetical protein
MDALRTGWQLTVLDADIRAQSLPGMAAGDFDGDGRIEVVSTGGAVLWHRPATLERGVIYPHSVHVGVALEDIDGDGLLEVVAAPRTDPEGKTGDWMIHWYKPGPDPTQPWTAHVIDPATTGGPHDLIFADVDNDGKNELIAPHVYCDYPGLFIYKPGADVTQPWQRHAVQQGFFGDGTTAADLDGDGWVEIVSGPYLYHCPPGGPFAGPWIKSTLAPAMREMCKATVLDITGNGRPDVIISEAEYRDGRISWFENRTREDPTQPWIEHVLERPVYYAHTLHAWHDKRGAAHIFTAEMHKGGWEASANWDARLIQYVSADKGKTWQRDLIYQGQGTQEAIPADYDGDGEIEIIGHETYVPRLHMWKRITHDTPLLHSRHQFIDRDKPMTGTDILAVDIDGDGLKDVVCAKWWYKNPTWQCYEIPGVLQILNAHDLDGDGKLELIAIKGKPPTNGWYSGINCDLRWLKAIDPVKGVWEEHTIGVGDGDWPHGTLIAPLLPGGKLALVTGYHSAEHRGDRPEIWEIPADPRQSPWPKRRLADIQYGEEFALLDVDDDGKMDLIAGAWWLENLGDGTFTPHRYADESFEDVCRLRVVDILGKGRAGVVLVEEGVDYKARQAAFTRIAWFERPADPKAGLWPMHIIDRVRSPHAVDVADLDGDGEIEIVVGEHDPFIPYRSHNRTLVYKKADPAGKSWRYYVVDNRFEHHDGAKVVELTPGKLSIISHSWAESKYVHLWQIG